MSDDLKSLIGNTVGRFFAETFTTSRVALFEESGDIFEGWSACSALGLDRALCRELHGGMGARPEDVFCIAHATGYYAAPVPLVETLMAGWLLSNAGIDPPPGVGILLDDTGSASPLAVSATAQASVAFVPWAQKADWAVAATRAGEGWTILLIDMKGAGVVMHRRANVAGEPDADVELIGAAVIARASLGGNDVNPVRCAGAMARAAQLIGSLERVLEMSVQYATERVQFGRPIGRNQALQQQLAMLAGQVASARLSALAAWGEHTISEFDISVAKIRASESAGLGAAIAHQVHGAIGFTHEHPLNYFTRRLWAWRAEFGSETWWSERLGRRAINAGKDAFWPSVVDRRWHA